MTTTIRARGPRELLAYVPYRLGYRPADSVVLVSLRPPRGRIGLVARADVDDLSDLEHGPQLARSLVTHLCGDGAARAALVLYSDVPLRGSVRGARERAAVEHAREAAEPFLGDVEAWVVSSSGYYALDCTDDDCCPPLGRPLRDLEGSEISAHMVLAGTTVADSRAASFLIRPAPGELRRRAARAAARWRRRGEEARAVPGASADWQADGLDAWRRAVALAERGDGGGSVLPAALLGRLEAALGSVPVRDAVLVSLVPGTGDLSDRTVGGGDVDEGTSRAIGAIVDPRSAVEPDEDLTAPARAVLEAVVAHGARGAQAPALTLLAVLAWWHGDGGRAGERARAALEHDPGYRLALLLDRALDAGVPPGWARAARV
ncbi:DUF4192 domain-containing protein [Oerskovia flava]|uniref:DUF4192 domain-containing protein n=1 Tax=Oerskovia flava TaxID=2986422 RepID=UPI0022406466|nr:DUF4192 domain-containing protein [Oerskovia sp. JB1-3-2]